MWDGGENQLPPAASISSIQALTSATAWPKGKSMPADAACTTILLQCRFAATTAEIVQKQITGLTAEEGLWTRKGWAGRST